MSMISAHPALSRTMQGEDMLQADEVVAMLRLHELGWGAKRLSKEFGCARNTVRRYLREGGAASFKKPVRRTAFDGLVDWLRERFFRHDGNADVIRQELASEHGIIIGLRSVELRVREWRRELKAQKRATVRFETPPGRQLQIDFERMSAGSATSKRTPSQVAGLRAGPPSRHIWIVGYVRSPISATTARLANLQLSALLARSMPFGLCQAVHRLVSCAISCARCRPTAPSISTPTVTPYPGVS